MVEVPQKIIPKKELITFWKSILTNKGLLNISTVTMIEHTIKRLEGLATTNKVQKVENVEAGIIMYRPKDWDETKWKTIPYNAPLISGEQVAKVYEAGADAMLTHLKSQEHADWLATEEGQKSKGEWYYIPEEKK